MTTDEKTYLIKLSQLKELCSSKNHERRYEIFADVLSCPYIEQSSGAVISKGLVKGGTAISGGIVKGVGKCFTATVEVIDRLSEPPKKVFLIKLSQLKELCSSKIQDRKYEIFADVLSCPYVEQSSGAVISKGLVKGGTAISGGIVKGVGKCFTATVEVIDRLSEPPRKGTGKS